MTYDQKFPFSTYKGHSRCYRADRKFIFCLPAGASVPFIHSHKNNEEIYVIIAGKGKAIIDNEEINLTTGDWLRISPAGKRQFFASKDSELTYICIQVKENSLEGFTTDDGIIY
ncbi:cupin domain-containing protein [Firmicutes bacterium AM43-11BH]|nr:cupin domain-containing protein [Firmicutes bacterium AM43-11BH]